MQPQLSTNEDLVMEIMIIVTLALLGFVAYIDAVK